MSIGAVLAAPWAAALGAEPIDAVPASTVLAARAPAPARSDSAQLIAWVGPPGIVHVAGERGRIRRTRDVSAACLEPPRSVTAVGGLQVLFDCLVPHDPQPRIEPRLLNVETGEVSVPAGAAAVLDDFREASGGLEAGPGAFLDVGWFGLRFSAGYYKEHVFSTVLDLRTGARVDDREEASSIVNLDSPELREPLCSPLRRVPYDLPPGIFGSTRTFNPQWYDHNRVVQWGPGTSLSVQRCSSRRKLILQARGRGAPRFDDVNLGGSIVTWTIPSGNEQAETLRAFLSECGVRVEWRIPQDAQVEPISEALVVNTPLGTAGPWQIRHVSLRGVCTRIRRAWGVELPNGSRVQARSATFSLPERAAEAVELEPLSFGVSRAVVRPGADLPLKFHSGARAVRWRLGGGAWERAVLPAREHGLGATLHLPLLSGPCRLTLDVRFRQGGAAHFALRLVPRG
ncbi:MAG TPA: hypothetical protein VGO48_15635 [Conexibacter sp.]|nr:hypothetical protein [Conexibacter sp.]